MQKCKGCDKLVMSSENYQMFIYQDKKQTL